MGKKQRRERERERETERERERARMIAGVHVYEDAVQ